MRRTLKRNRAHGIESVVLHLGVERRGFHAQQSRRLRLITAAAAERAFDQLNLISLNFAVEVDAVVIENYLFVAVAIDGEFGLQSFNLACESLREQC